MLEKETKPTLQEVELIAREAGKLLMTRYGKAHDIKMKGKVDLVTEADHLSEELILGHIKKHYPLHTIISEESGSNHQLSDHTWYIDPLDGTINFAHGIPLFCVSIAYAFQEKLQLGVVYDPTRDECFSAEFNKGAWLNGNPIRVSKTKELIQSLIVTGFPYTPDEKHITNLEHYSYFSLRTRGVRRLGSAAIDLGYVASGRLDAYWELDINVWDIAAGCLIASEAGAIVSDVKGHPLDYRQISTVLVTNPFLHSDVLRVLLQGVE
jgi:myo-inositol-1(or 4)-monophosphatase